MEKVIDAKGRTLGRIASEAATHLRGKNSAEFERNVDPKTTVKIINAGEMKLSVARLSERHLQYSGYPGGLSSLSKGEVLDKHGIKRVLQFAVKGMLPKNRLAERMIKRLSIEG